MFEQPLPCDRFFFILSGGIFRSGSIDASAAWCRFLCYLTLGFISGPSELNDGTEMFSLHFTDT